MSRAKRWIVRIMLALLALVTVLVIAAVIFMHTDFGREQMRAKVNAQLATMLSGGGHVGKLEGTPLGELVLRDVVINGPDHLPAIQIKTLRLDLHVSDLLSHHVRIGQLIAEDVELVAKRDASGRLELAQLLAPNDKSSWKIDLSQLEIRRGHFVIDTGTAEVGVMNLDEVALTGNVTIDPRGSVDVGLHSSATWRERAVPITVAMVVHDDVEHTAIASLSLQAGALAVSGSDIELTKRAGKLPLVSGHARIVAPRAAVMKVAPDLDPRQDLALSIVAAANDCTTTVTVDGTVGVTAVHVAFAADLDARRAVGTATVADLELATWTSDAYVATVGGDIAFDVTPGAAGDWPTARATVRGHTHGTVDATLVLELVTTGRTATLERASLIGSTRDPSRITNGRVAIYGVVDASLTAHGMLAPTTDLAVAGSINGDHVRFENLTVGSLRAAVDATHLPRDPRGHASVAASDVILGNRRLGALTAKLSNRPDGKIDVALQSHPVKGQWRAELEALVTPPGRGEVVTVELLNHHVRLGAGSDWTGTSGQLRIDPRRVELRDLRSSSRSSELAVAGTYTLSGDSAGDVIAKVTATGVRLDELDASLTGIVSAHADVARHRGLWSGEVDVTGTGIVLERGGEPLDGHATVDARPGTVTVVANASGARLGAAQVALDLAPPRDVTDLAAWRARGRSAIRSIELTAHGLDLGRLAPIIGVQTDVTGRLDGTFSMTPTTVSADLEARGLYAPELERVGPVDADLRLVQSDVDTIAPTLTIKIANIGTITARGEMAMPNHVLDPAAWQQLGSSAIHHATISLHDVALEPSLLARFGIVRELRGRASIDIQIAEALKSIQITGDVAELRGAPLTRPVDVHAEIMIDGTTARTTLAIRTTKAIPLFDAEAQIPFSLDRLRAHPETITTLPLVGTLTVAPTSAPMLFNLFGHSEVIAGTIGGSATLGGTVGMPTIVAHVVGEHLAVPRPPGPRDKPMQPVDRLVIDATWSEHRGTLKIDGVEPAGGMLSVVAEGSPWALDAVTAKVEATHFDLGVLLAFVPGSITHRSAGVLDADLSIKGFDPRTSKLAGEIHLVDARVPIAPTIGTLRDAKVDITIHEHDLKVAIKGKLGAGTVVLDGAIALDGASLTGGVAKLTLRKVSPIGSIEPVIDADVSAKLAHVGMRWTADLVVDNGSVKLPNSSGEELKPVGAPADMRFTTGGAKIAAVKRPPEQPIFVVNVVFHDTRIESEDVRTVIRGKLALTADTVNVGVVGTIEGVRGELTLFDRRYKIETAFVSFDGSTDPGLDIQIVYDFPSVELITRVTGRLSKPKLELTSIPGGYTRSQLLGFLLGGEPNGDVANGGARDKIDNAAASLVANRIGGYVKKSLPFTLDVIRYEAAGVRSSAAITVGSWVTHSLFFALHEHIAARPDENVSEGTLEYWITHRLEIEGVVGDRGYDGVDLLWRKRYGR